MGFSDRAEFSVSRAKSISSVLQLGNGINLAFDERWKGKRNCTKFFLQSSCGSCLPSVHPLKTVCNAISGRDPIPLFPNAPISAAEVGAKLRRHGKRTSKFILNKDAMSESISDIAKNWSAARFSLWRRVSLGRMQRKIHVRHGG